MFNFRGAEYTIKTTWNNLTTSHLNNLVTVQLDKQDAESFKVIVKAPFFDDPPAPSGPTPSGESLFGLWDFERNQRLYQIITEVHR